MKAIFTSTILLFAFTHMSFAQEDFAPPPNDSVLVKFVLARDTVNFDDGNAV